MNKKLNENSISEKGKSGIKIKKANKGKFTDYCGGKVTDECILKGLNSSDPAVRKRANFARNARKWKHGEGGYLHTFKIRPNHVMDSNPRLDNMSRKYEGGGGLNSNWVSFASLAVGAIVGAVNKYNLAEKKFKSSSDLLEKWAKNKKLQALNEAMEKSQNELDKFNEGKEDLGVNTNSSAFNNFFVYTQGNNIASKDILDINNLQKEFMFELKLEQDKATLEAIMGAAKSIIKGINNTFLNKKFSVDNGAPSKGIYGNLTYTSLDAGKKVDVMSSVKEAAKIYDTNTQTYNANKDLVNSITEMFNLNLNKFL